MKSLSALVILFVMSSTASASWLKKSNILSWQMNPQLYLLGVAPKCSQSKARLSPLQNTMCVSGGYQDHMSSVNIGLLLALNECQYQFKSSRWNCSDVELESMLEGLRDARASKEDAFLHASTSAGIAHAVSRSCRKGLIPKCGCSTKSRPKSLNRDWVWGGCGDNLNYGYEFAVGFVDLREKERNYPKGSPDLAVMLMNKHNNEAGRRTVQKGDVVACKCHGVSGSCSLKTCWQELSPFREIGSKLKDNYDTAMQVSFNKDGTRLRNAVKRRSKRRATKDELIYLKTSPDYCQSNITGSTGTSGRECNPASSGEDNCDVMCCGKGYDRKTVTTKDRCNCSFQWCCFVKCDTCTKQTLKHICK